MNDIVFYSFLFTFNEWKDHCACIPEIIRWFGFLSIYFDMILLNKSKGNCACIHRTSYFFAFIQLCCFIENDKHTSIPWITSKTTWKPRNKKTTLAKNMLLILFPKNEHWLLARSSRCTICIIYMYMYICSLAPHPMYHHVCFIMALHVVCLVSCLYVQYFSHYCTIIPYM